MSVYQIKQLFAGETLIESAGESLIESVSEGFPIYS